MRRNVPKPPLLALQPIVRGKTFGPRRTSRQKKKCRFDISHLIRSYPCFALHVFDNNMRESEWAIGTDFSGLTRFVAPVAAFPGYDARIVMGCLLCLHVRIKSTYRHAANRCWHNHRCARGRLHFRILGSRLPHENVKSYQVHVVTGVVRVRLNDAYNTRGASPRRRYMLSLALLGSVLTIRTIPGGFAAADCRPPWLRACP